MAQQGQQRQGDDSADIVTIVLGLLLLFGLGWLLWRSFGEEVVTAYKYSRFALLSVAGLVSLEAADLAERVRVMDPSGFTWDRFTAFASHTGAYTRWLLTPVLIAVAVSVYLSSYATRFRKVHSMRTLVQQERTLWPEISPVANLDLVASDPFKGEWAVSMSEREFVRHHGLIKDDGKLDPASAEKAFARQMGPLWLGVDRMRPHEKAMFAVFAMRIGGDQDGALSAIRRLASSYASNPQKVDYTWVADALTKHADCPLVARAISRHAYVRTLLATMLQLARIEGVFSSGLWTWLKPVDRELFYTLNCVGRYADFVEVAGITAHWKAEKKLGVPLARPCVSSAIEGLERALGEFCDDDALNKHFE